LLILGFGGMSVLLALLYRFVRKHVYHDANNVDVAFDAGGRVSTSLTAVTVASQFLWPGDILQSSTITVKVRLKLFLLDKMISLLVHLNCAFLSRKL